MKVAKVMKIELINLTFDNYEQVLKLKPSKEQEKYVRVMQERNIQSQ